MMKKSVIASFALLLLALSACQKESDPSYKQEMEKDDAISFMVKEAEPFVTKSSDDMPVQTYSQVIFSQDSLDLYLNVNESNYHADFFSESLIETKGAPYQNNEIGEFFVSAFFSDMQQFFSNAKLKNYFSQYSWYHPAISPDSFAEDLLNSYQIANRDLIVSHENTLKSADLDPLQYFIENCDRRYFTTAEISGLSKEELQYARNAIYAKSGRIFSMEKLASYFAKYSWYTPYIPADEFTEDMLNSYQTANRDLIVARENELNGITAEEAYAIACRYWDYHEGDIAEESGFPLYVVDDGTVEHNGTMYYFFRLRWMVTDENGSSWMSTLDQVYINSKNGECTYTIYS
jgi:hypothetical protein